MNWARDGDFLTFDEPAFGCVMRREVVPPNQCRCGADNAGNACFCRKCGHNLTWQQTDADPAHFRAFLVAGTDMGKTFDRPTAAMSWVEERWVRSKAR